METASAFVQGKAAAATAANEARGKWKVAGLLGVAGLGLVARLLVIAFSNGTNDLPTWEGFARSIDEHGLGWMYEHDPIFNHPPLIAALAWGLYRLAMWTGVSFGWWFRLVSVAGECGIALLLWKRWRPEGARRAAAAVAVYAWCLDAILVSAFHGNTDVLVALGCLAVCFLLEGSRPFAAGLALGAAINVKLAPVMLIPALLLSLRDRQTLTRFVGGLSIGTVPFVVMLALHPRGFAQHVLGYASCLNKWGFGFVLDLWVANTRHAPIPVAVLQAFNQSGRWLPVTLSAGVGLAARRAGKLDRYELAALVFSLFFVFTPGFAVQYTIWVCPLLFAVGLRWGALYGASVGLFCAFVYYCFWDHHWPAYSGFDSGLPMHVARVGLYAWGALIAFSTTRLWRLRSRR